MTDDVKPWFPIRTPRLLLREFRDDDLKDVHAYAADRPRNLTVPIVMANTACNFESITMKLVR